MQTCFLKFVYYSCPSLQFKCIKTSNFFFPPSHLSVLHLSETILEPRLLVVRAASSHRLRLYGPDRGRRSARRPGGRGGEEALQGRSRSRNLDSRERRRSGYTLVSKQEESVGKSFSYLQHLMDLHAGLRGVLHSDLDHGGGRGGGCRQH